MANGKNEEYPIIVIGAGAGGLVVAVGAAKAGKKVLLIEKGPYGGDCTNFGCIPSKSLIAAAHAARYLKEHAKWGLESPPIHFNSAGAFERARSIVEEIREHEEPQALERIGINTLTGVATFKNPHILEVRLPDGEVRIVKGKNIVIATGSFPAVPDLRGLKECSFCTNETIFDLETVPKRLGVIGGGPVGCELAQAFRRLGCQVVVIEHNAHLLVKEEVEAQQILEEIFREEGITLKTHCQPLEVKKQNGTIKIVLVNHASNKNETIEVDQLLVSTGRRPNIESLDLKNIGVSVNQRGIEVDVYGRTSLKHIWALGDVVGNAMYTHVAENEARTVLTNLLLPWPFGKKLDRAQAIPRVFYTDPEIASVGLTEPAASRLYGREKIAVYTVPFSEVDRAITAGRTEGLIKIVTKKWTSRILGATIIAPRAGEMLPQITTAMRAKIPLRKLSSLIHPYPTYSMAIRKAADQWLTKTILPIVMRWVGKNK